MHKLNGMKPQASLRRLLPGYYQNLYILYVEVQKTTIHALFCEIFIAILFQSNKSFSLFRTYEVSFFNHTAQASITKQEHFATILYITLHKLIRWNSVNLTGLFTLGIRTVIVSSIPSGITLVLILHSLMISSFNTS